MSSETPRIWQPLEIYVHLPFCVKKCDYCDFLSGPYSEDIRSAYVQAVLKEIRSLGRRERAENWKVRSIFFGGGTPSLMNGEEITQILDEIRRDFQFEPEAEISLEANPGTLTENKLKAYQSGGINRLSLGCQSAKDQELKRLGRIHTWEEFLKSYHMAREAGFQNINVDLMSGIPGQSVLDWEENLEAVLALTPEHISAYSLIVEEGTPFYERELNLPDEDSERRMYERTREILEEHGYHQYEISNYALRGKECLHNLGYWQRVSYLGVGLGAASLRKNVRYCNTSDLKEYLVHGADLDVLQKQREVLTQREEMEEFLFLGLRMIQGIREEEFLKNFGRPLEEAYGNVIEKHEKLGLLERLDGRLRLTRRGISLSNQVFVDFLS